MKEEPTFDPIWLALALGLLVAVIVISFRVRCARAGCGRCRAILSGAVESPRRPIPASQMFGKQSTDEGIKYIKDE